MYSINNMSHIAKLITKTRYGATHSRFIYRISESLRNVSFNPAELEMLRELSTLPCYSTEQAKSGNPRMVTP